MPLVRYFLFVGGALLALMFVVDAVLPKLPVSDRANTDLPAIRIHTDRKWPERVVFDTSLPTVVPVTAAKDANGEWRGSITPDATRRPIQIRFIIISS